MESCLRVPAEDLRELVAGLFEKAGTSRQDAELMARLLEEIGQELGVESPFAAFEHTRFELDMSMF